MVENGWYQERVNRNDSNQASIYMIILYLKSNLITFHTF